MKSKFDGYRFQCHVLREVKFYTRRGHDWSNRLGRLEDAIRPLANHSVVLDGEVIVQTPEGRSDFHALEKELKRRGGSDRLVYVAFDILYLDGFDLRGAALVERKRVLAELLSGLEGPVKISDHLEGDGQAILKKACQLDLEGIVSKRADSKYVSSRSPHWIKTTCRHRDTFVVVGWASRLGRFDGIYLGRAEGGKLVYAGKLEAGFSEADKKALIERLAPLLLKVRPMITSRKSFPKAKWVKPVVLVEAEYRGKTGEGFLRHPSFKGIREDLIIDQG